MNEVVATTEYPTPLPWPERASSLQYVPKGSISLIEALRLFLHAIDHHAESSAHVQIPGITRTPSLDSICQRISKMGLVIKNDNGWSLTHEARRWIQTEDNLYLAAIICSRTKFAGEHLALLHDPKSTKELFDIAREQYGMTWKTVNQVHARNDWFCALGLVQHYTQINKYALTSAGRSFLLSIDIMSPADIRAEFSKASAQHESASPWAIEMCDLTAEQLESREISIQRIPGRGCDYVTTISKAVSYLERPRTLAEFDDFARHEYGLGKQASQSYRSSLRTLGLLHDVPNAIQATEDALRWNVKPTANDLAFYLHAKRKYVFEILQFLEEKPRTRAELTVNAQIVYDAHLTRADRDRRIDFLRNAGLIEGAKILALTESGKRVLSQVKIQPADKRQGKEKSSSSDAASGLSQPLIELLQELRLASTNSHNYRRFEAAVARAFEFLGFKTASIGGPNDTDVLLTSNCSERYSYHVVVDAKTSINVRIAKSNIDYDSIDDHAKKNVADYVVVVAPSFAEKKVVEHARRHKALLIDVDKLSDLLRKHETAPLTTHDYELLFRNEGPADLSMLEPTRNKLLRNSALLHAVLNYLMKISAERAETPDAIRAVLENDSSLNLAPISKGEIVDVLEFLSSPMIKCVEADKDGYYSVISLAELSSMLKFYGETCQLLSQ